MELEQKWSRRSAWILGTISIFCAGLFQIPRNLQGTIVYSALLVLFWVRIRGERAPLQDSSVLYLFFGLLFAFLLVLTTNSLLVFALHASIWFLLIDFLVRSYAPDRYSSIAGFTRQVALLLRAFLVRLFSRGGIAGFLPIKATGSGQNSSTTRWALVVASVIGSILLFYIFHLLFSEINADYKAFMDPFVQWLWTTFIKNACLTLIHAYLMYALLTAKRFEPRGVVSFGLPAVTAIVVLAGLVFVTAVFTFFQTRFILLDAPELKFSELSKYTQKGFLQLIVAIILGYCITLFSIHSNERGVRRSIPLVALILFFLFELFFSAFFSGHKLYLLQSVFGLKDQRILASVGILFVFFSLSLLAWRSLRSGAERPGFKYQILFLLVSVSLVSIFNVDSVATRVNTIRYYRDNVSYPDYSYLLGNSYDNVSEWPGLISRMQSQSPPHPGPGYFWGFESPSGSDAFLGRYSPFCHSRAPDSYVYRKAPDGVPRLLPTQLLAQALRKYGKPGEGVTIEGKSLARPSFELSEFLNFNWREYQAYLYIRDSPDEVLKFTAFVEGYCR
ncbi:MAG: DUF4173 domain-containing protein [Leptospirales bacterium]|nr:DUF4173 domain-containing protein [Leptospirales bacterium]